MPACARQRNVRKVEEGEGGEGLDEEEGTREERTHKRGAADAPPTSCVNVRMRACAAGEEGRAEDWSRANLVEVLHLPVVQVDLCLIHVHLLVQLRLPLLELGEHRNLGAGYVVDLDAQPLVLLPQAVLLLLLVRHLVVAVAPKLLILLVEQLHDLPEVVQRCEPTAASASSSAWGGGCLWL